MEKIHISFMKDLRNNEFGELFDIVSTIVTAEKIGLPYLTMACEQLHPHAKELLKMNNQKIRHPLTQIIREQVNTRTEYLASVRMTVDAKMMWHKPEHRLAAARLQLWLRTYKDEIYAPTIAKQSALIEDLIADWKESASIKEATALLDLDELLAELVKLTASIRRNQLIRLNEKDIYEVDGQAIRKAAFKDLKMLVSVIDSSYNIGANAEQRKQLAALSQSLNAALQEFHAVLKSRNTKSKNKKERAAAVNVLIDCELKDPKLESEKSNLPVVIYEELRLPKAQGASASYISICTHNGGTLAIGGHTRDTTNNQKFYSKKGRIRHLGQKKIRQKDLKEEVKVCLR